MSLFASDALANKKIAVLPIEGDKKEELVLDLRDMLVDDHTLASQREVTKIYDLLKGDGLSIEDMENIAARTRVDYVIDGKLVVSRGNSELTLWVRDSSGVAVKKLFATYKGQLGDAAKAELGAALRDAIDAIGKPSGGKTPRARDDKDDEDDPPADGDRGGWGSKGRERDTERDRRGSRDDEDERDARDTRDDDDDDRRDRRRDDDEDVRDRDRDRRDDDDDDRSSRKRRDRDDDDDDRDRDRDRERDREPEEPAEPRVLDKVWATAQFAVLNRTLSFTGFRSGFTEQPGGYKGSIVPGVRADFEAFPMADKSGFAGALGVYGSFERAFVINVRSSQAAGTKLPTTMQHYGAGVVARFRLGTSATIQAGVGYGTRSFVVNRSPLASDQSLDLPDVAYKYADPSVAVGFGLGKHAVLTLGGRFFLVLNAGDIQTPQEYGRSKITGGQGELGLNINASPRVVIRVSGAASVFGFDFEPGAQQTNGRDGDLATQDVGGARDVYIMAGVGVGVRF